MTKDKIFTDIQNIVSNNPVVIIGSGASVSYGIPGMGTLAAELKSFFSSKTFPNVDSQKSVQDFLENLKKGLGLEEALLETLFLLIFIIQKQSRLKMDLGTKLKWGSTMLM